MQSAEAARNYMGASVPTSRDGITPARTTITDGTLSPLEARLRPFYTGIMHVHDHGAGGPTRVLKISLGVTLAYIVLLVVAGVRSHSLALLSEAGHNLSDFLALA